MQFYDRDPGSNLAQGHFPIHPISRSHLLVSPSHIVSSKKSSVLCIQHLWKVGHECCVRLVFFKWNLIINKTQVLNAGGLGSEMWMCVHLRWVLIQSVHVHVRYLRMLHRPNVDEGYGPTRQTFFIRRHDMHIDTHNVHRNTHIKEHQMILKWYQKGGLRVYQLRNNVCYIQWKK